MTEPTPTTIEDTPKMVPCKIFVDFRTDPFVVHDVGAWQYTDQGVFATGYWRSAAEWLEVPPADEDVLISDFKINFIRFDWDALEAFMADNTTETEEVLDGAGA